MTTVIPSEKADGQLLPFIPDNRMRFLLLLTFYARKTEMSTLKKYDFRYCSQPVFREAFFVSEGRRKIETYCLKLDGLL